MCMCACVKSVYVYVHIMCAHFEAVVPVLYCVVSSQMRPHSKHKYIYVHICVYICVCVCKRVCMCANNII